MNDYSSEYGTWITYVLVWGVSAAITGAVPGWKNRSVLRWAIGGIFFPCTALLILLFLPRLCPDCHSPLTHDEWKAKECPRCKGDRAHQEVRGNADG